MNKIYKKSNVVPLDLFICLKNDQNLQNSPLNLNKKWENLQKLKVKPLDLFKKWSLKNDQNWEKTKVVPLENPKKWLKLRKNQGSTLEKS